jgi:hypothetical protein
MLQFHAIVWRLLWYKHTRGMKQAKATPLAGSPPRGCARSEDKKENQMRKFFKLCSVVSVFAVAVGLFPSIVQAQYVFVNDNNGNTGANTVTVFENSPITTLNPPNGTPYVTNGSGLAGVSTYSALKNQASYTLGTPPATSCLLVSDPTSSTGFPNGDIAVFNVTNATGVLTLTSRFATPAGNSGALYGIGLAAGGKFLYAAYSHSHTIAIFTLNWNGSECLLDYIQQISATGFSGGSVEGMSLSANFQHVVVAYGDGSVQSFRAVGNSLTPDCAPQKSAGFTDGNGGLPAGVDITADSLYAIFGDANTSPAAPTEVEVALLPINCRAAVTRDFGGLAHVNTNLGTGKSSDNVWLSPSEAFIYVTNNVSKQMTTIGYIEPYTLALVPPGNCSAGHHNPTTLHTAGTTYTIPAGIQTSTTTGTGSRLYVAEYGDPSEVALLGVDAAGCTQEAPASPFTDPQSNFTSNAHGSYSLNVHPARPF